MRSICVIGIGPGDPELITIKAVNALNEAGLILIPLKGDEKDDLAELRRTICRRYLKNTKTRVREFELPRRDQNAAYLGSVNDWHDEIAATYNAIIESELPADGSLALLVWGDPSLYDSTHRVLDRLRAHHRLTFDVDVVPGITSVQALTARHAMPLNALGGSVLYTTGRRLREGVPDDVDTIVVMLDGEASFRHLPMADFEIYWGAYLGMDAELLFAGPLASMASEIVEARSAARDANGWIMDVYVLRRHVSA